MPVRLPRFLSSPSLLGLSFAVVALHQSMAPTLLVRNWYFQGVVTGVAMVLGYAVGALLQRGVLWLWRLGARAWEERQGRAVPRPTEATAQKLHLGFLVVLAVLAVLAVVDTIQMQRWTWERLHHNPDLGARLLMGTALVAAAVAGLLYGIYALFRWLRSRGTWLADKVLPRWIAAGLATVLALYVLTFALNNWVYQRTLDGLNETFTIGDSEIEQRFSPPASTLRSGGAESEIAWEDLGREGRRFVNRGPSVEQIAALDPTEKETVEPIRVFVGRQNADELEQRVEMAMEEMERFGAFERELVLVVIPTGTGWINEQIVEPLEYMFSGDVATVAMQYSHLPSPLAFLTEAQAAQATGEALISAVRERLATIPEDERPTFAVAGESLGTFGASGAFDGLQDVLDSTDASLWVGPPSSVHLRLQAENERTEDSLQIKPTWSAGDRVLFANRAADLTGLEDRDLEAVFLQQADDAIVWWDWPTLWEQPDWLSEPLDESVNPEMRWYPVSTMLNLAVDMAVATAFDDEQGHKYGTQPTLAWRAMFNPEGWDDAAHDELMQVMLRVDRDG